MPDLPDELPVIDDFPAFVGTDEADRYRWRACVGIAKMMDDRSWPMIARALHRSDIPTDVPEQQELSLGPERNG